MNIHLAVLIENTGIIKR